MAYMKHNLLKEIEIGSKNALVKKRIITHYIYNGSSTITDLSKEMDLSVPTVTKFIDEMCEDGYINDYGKLETSGGRHPNTDLIRNPGILSEWILKNSPSISDLSTLKEI